MFTDQLPGDLGSATPKPPRRQVHVEQRKFGRYRLDLPVSFMWRDAQGECEQGAGFTYDISMAGMFVVSDRCPPADAQVWCEVMLPRSYGRDTIRRLRVAGPALHRKTSGADEHPTGFVIHGSPFLLVDEADKEEWVRLLADQQSARAQRGENDNPSRKEEKQ